eukprot:6801607-Pyramimonas_sp.AAC.2
MHPIWRRAGSDYDYHLPTPLRLSKRFPPRRMRKSGRSASIITLNSSSKHMNMNHQGEPGSMLVSWEKCFWREAASTH